MSKVSPLRRSEPPKDTVGTWFWILLLAGILLLSLVAAFKASAQGVVENRPHFACPPGPGQVCVAKVQAPASPQVDRVCLRRVGSTAIEDALCVDAEPGARVEISFTNPTAGQGHRLYEVVACDDDLGLCSTPSERIAIAVDLDTPTFFEVLRKALGL